VEGNQRGAFESTQGVRKIPRMPPPPTLPPPPPRSGTSFASAKSGISVQRRRHKQEDEISHNGHNAIGNGNGNANSGERRSGFKRKLFRGDRKKVYVQSLIAGAILILWISLFRLQSVAISNTHDNVKIKPIDQTGKSNEQMDSSENATKRIVGKDDNYDSIFCRAGSSRVHLKQSKIDIEKTNSSNNRAKPVFLWGIPSTTSQFETGRRDLLRKTYLDFFQQIKSNEDYLKTNATTVNSTLSENKNLICSLHDWTCDANVRADCQMIYVFFVGGHDESFHNNVTKSGGIKGTPTIPPPILLNESITDFREMLLPPKQNKKGFDLTELGTVYLDIRENQFDGKMTTWFKFASLVATEYNEATIPGFPKIEYAFKVDSDLMLLTPNFFRWFYGVHQERQTPNKSALQSNSLVEKVYGGIEFPATNCVENFTFDHPCPLPLSGPSYMSGELNFMSVDLATYIASDDCPRDEWTIPHEDVSLSNYVYSYTNNTAYHKREKENKHIGNDNGNNLMVDNDHSIHIVSVDTSRVLLLPSMRANWETISLRKNPDLIRNGEFLWGHSIKRGNHTQYLYWKKDSKFLNFWRFFMKIYTTTGKVTRGRKKKDAQQGNENPLSKLQSERRKRKEEKNLGRILWEKNHVQSF